ncbi:PepSY domain-containing protein [Flavobacterium sp. NKUCC04_CG]|uniref:PepSY-associated TM helix domain-containing protein n=1 Tax=Flavobacterium sp. NKUCC04_CG TaxID=2842121 RepID=UPI001C5A65B8|nr:PepSY-associated TM helix domain-containing protein [Flavobacterium sp. NKUCC04_CG]MBW3517673.1 PepSY domain-containing protein [Flavobacterium sp. NKUCC04_CG]
MSRKSKPTWKQRAKKILGQLHLWLGLLSGIIVFIVSITGAIYVFNEDITHFTRSHVIYHGEQSIENKKPLPVYELQRIVNDYVQEEISSDDVTIPIDKNQSYQFGFNKTNRKGWNYFDTYLIYKNAYVNQYTGEVLGVYNIRENIFFFTMILHRSLLLNAGIGSLIVGIATIIFTLMLITGIVLWWPKNKKAAKQRIWFRWKNIKGWKRKNYDLHNILGFYASLIAMIVALTGLCLSFRILTSGIYMLLSGGTGDYPNFDQYKTTAPESVETLQTIEEIIEKVRYYYPDAASFGLDLEDHSQGDHHHDNLSIYVKNSPFTYYDNHLLIFDEHSGDLLFNRPYQDQTLAEKVVGANYDIHVGGILGFGGKLLAFVSSLICASLPITGFLVWWGRKKKKRKTITTQYHEK